MADYEIARSGLQLNPQRPMDYEAKMPMCSLLKPDSDEAAGEFLLSGHQNLKEVFKDVQKSHYKNRRARPFIQKRQLYKALTARHVSPEPFFR
jgi:hypothetical protein